MYPSTETELGVLTIFRRHRNFDLRGLIAAGEKRPDRGLHQGHVHALALRQPVRDDRVAVELVVRRLLIVAPLAPAAIGVEILLDRFDGDGRNRHFVEVGGFALNIPRACWGRYGRSWG
jgi:hypothetical protein